MYISNLKIKYNKFKKIFFLIFVVLFFSFLGANNAMATGNVYGWAWTENIGWISFNDVGLKSDGTESADPTGLAIPAGINSSDPHFGIHYGVNIEENGELTGYAWSENIGWIKFNDNYDSTYDDGYPAPPYNSVQTGLDGTGYPLSGWARACSVFASGCSGALNLNRGGWDGWIKMQDGAYIDSKFDPAQFRNWVWGGNPDSDPNKSVIGWGTFNCKEGGVGGTSVCLNTTDPDSPVNYRVVTTFCGACAVDGDCSLGEVCCTGVCCDGVCCAEECCDGVCIDDECRPEEPPEIIQWPPPDEPLGTPPLERELQENRCSNSITFQWKYVKSISDIEESKFDFQISSTDWSDLQSNNCPGICEVNLLGISHTTYPRDTNSYRNSYPVPVKATPTTFGGNYLTYKTNYYWRVRVYDQNDPALASIWYEGQPFETWLHSYPYAKFNSNWPNNTFTWVNKSAPISFTNDSRCYDIDNNYADCASYYWDFGDGSNNTDESPSYTYTSTDNLTKTYPVQLTVCDTDDYCCTASQNMTVKNPMNVPQWQEISPF